MFQDTTSNEHIHFTWNIRKGKVTRSGQEGARIFHCIWGSSVNYEDRGFLSMSYYERCNIPNIVESCTKHDITHLFEDWTTDSDDEARKEPESEDELPDLLQDE